MKHVVPAVASVPVVRKQVVPSSAKKVVPAEASVAVVKKPVAPSSPPVEEPG